MAFPKKGALNLHRIVLNNINVLIIPEIISIVLIDTYDILHRIIKSWIIVLIDTYDTYNILHRSIKSWIIVLIDTYNILH